MSYFSYIPAIFYTTAHALFGGKRIWKKNDVAYEIDNNI